jgi:hypothetical protein
MRSAKSTLMQQSRMIDDDFMGLTRNMLQANDMQLRNLEAIKTSIDSLQGMIEALPDGPIALKLCHDMRNQLTVMRGFTELLKYGWAGALDAAAIVFVDKILDFTRLIEATIEANTKTNEPLRS